MQSLERRAALRAVADRALDEAMSAFDLPVRSAQIIGTTVEVKAPPRVEHDSARVWVTRLSGRVFWMVTRATDDIDSTVSAGAGLVVRIDAPRFPRIAALVARGGVHLDGASTVTGVSVAEPPCDSVIPPLDGLVVPPGVAAPAIARRLSLANADSTYLSFGPIGVAQLTQRAAVTLAAGVTISPPASGITLATGDLTLEPGAGAGVLLVLGRLHVQGSVTFSGVLIADDGLDVASGQLSVTGLVLSAAAHDSSIVVRGTAALDARYSECAVVAAEFASAAARPAITRAKAPMP